MHDIKHTVLAVDDEEANLDAIQEILSTQYQVHSAASGMAALDYLQEQQPDLILMDVEMPEMTGIELFTILRSHETLSKVPVIFLTADSDVESEASLLYRGAVDYIRKPINNIIVQTRVKMQLELAMYRKQGYKVRT